MTEIRHIHMIAICGTGMGALAGMLQSKGYRITGSDAAVYPPMSTQLADMGIEVYEGFDASHLEPAPDLVVIGNAMSRGNPEVEYTLAHELAYTSMAAAIEELFLTDRTPVVVAGTHGKTTTTSLIAWLFESAGRDPSMFVGGVPLNFGRGWKVGQGEVFVIEGDEYDTAFFDKESKFLHYRPQTAIITSVEFDHADIFDDLDQIKAAFEKLVGHVPAGGRLLIDADSPVAREVSRDAVAPVETYGLETGDWRVRNPSWADGRARFELLHGETPVGTFESPLLGRHNLRNAVVAIAVGLGHGLSAAEIATGLATFRGIKRRQETRGEVGGVLVIDDFAHHPTAVRETLSALRLGYPDRRIWAIFEPRSNTAQRSVFHEEYVEAFSRADEVVVARLFAPHKVKDGTLFDLDRLVADISARGTHARHITDTDSIIQTVCQERKPGDLVAILSNGGFDDIHRRLLKALAEAV